MCFEKMLLGISETVNARAWENPQIWWMLELSTFAIVFSTPQNLLVKKATF